MKFTDKPRVIPELRFTYKAALPFTCYREERLE